MEPPGGRRPAAPPPNDSIDASSLELVLRALGAVGTVEGARPAQPEQRGPVFNWNDDDEAVPKPAATHKDGERSASRGPCKCGFKHWLKGIEYDWVIPIPTTVGMLLLGYNKSEDPYDAAARFIEDQKVRDSGLLDNSLAANLVEYIIACTEAGDEPNYVSQSSVATTPLSSSSLASASSIQAAPTKEELEAREQLRLKREKELRAEKDKAEAQKLEVRRQIELDKQNRRKEAEARRKEEEERRAQAAQTPTPTPSSTTSSGNLAQPSPPPSLPVSPVTAPANPTAVHPAPRPVRDPWSVESDEDFLLDDQELGYVADLNRLGFPPRGAPRRTGGHIPASSSSDYYSRLRKTEWTMEDVLQVYRTEGQMGLLARLRNAGFTPDEMVRLVQYAAMMDQADRTRPMMVGAPPRSPEPQVFRGPGHTLRSSEPTTAAAPPPPPSSSASSNILSSSADPAAVPAPASAPVDPITVDPTKPKTCIKIRLHSGQQIIAHFNHTHTVLDIRRHIEIICPLPSGASYELLLPPPGRVVLADHSITIAKAGLQNATVIQSIR